MTSSLTVSKTTAVEERKLGREREAYLGKIEPQAVSYIAGKIVKECLGVRPGENITIETWTHGLEIAKQFVFQVRKAGASPVLLLEDEDTFWRTAAEIPPAKLGKVGKHEWSILQNTDAYIFLPGPEDMERFDNLPDKVFDAFESVNEEWYARARRSKVRGVRVGLGYVTHGRAKKLGIDYDEWIQEEVSALDVDYEQIDKSGRKIASLFKTGKRVTVSHDNGTNLEFRLQDVHARKPVVDTGVMKKQYDPSSGRKYGVLTNVPAGSVLIAPDEDSARGTIKFNLPTPSEKGFTKDVSLSFGKDGRLTEYEGGENFQENFKKRYEKEKKPDKAKAALFSIGLNSKQKTGFGFDDSSEGVVLFGIGHYSYGDRNKTSFRFYGLLEDGTVAIDGKVIAKNGRVLV